MQHNFEVGTVLATAGFRDWVVRKRKIGDKEGIPVGTIANPDAGWVLDVSDVTGIVSVPEPPEPEISETTDGDFAYALAEVCANLGGAMSFFYEDQFGGQNHQTVADVETYESGGHKYIAGKNSTGQYRQFRTDRVLGDVEAWRDEA